MNRSKLLLVLFITIFQIGITVYAQKVSNITYRQEQSNIIVSYDLETKTPCKVSLYVSTNDGKTWLGPLSKITGDVGNKITSGNYDITWKVLEEFEELRGNKIKFQVRAVVNNIKTVVIGTQEWTSKNLNVSKYRNGDIIPEVKDSKKWGHLKTGAWCYFNNDPKNGAIYGKLYNWYAINDPRGIAPDGFHIPTYAEWSTLIDYLGGPEVAPIKMTEKGTAGWASPNPDVANSSGFTALDSGDRDGQDGSFNILGSFGSYWSSTIVGIDSSSLFFGSGEAILFNPNKVDGLSVRCIRD